jgi:hypothetical protein
MTDAWIKTASALVALLSSAGIVTATGGAVLWARFHASQLPADQAVAAVPSHELVAVGAVALVGFVIGGVVALVGVYALDSTGEPGPRTRRGLVALMLGEIAVAVFYGGSGAIGTLVLIVAFAVAALVLLLLLDDLATTSLPQNQTDWLQRLGRWLWAQTFADATVLGRVRRGVALVALAFGVFVIARADQWIWPILYFVLVGVLVVWPWGAIWDARARRIGGIALLAYGATALIRFDGSLAVVTAAALLLGLVNLGIAKATGQRFAFYGVAVFVSVVLFGAALSYVRSIANPKLQAVAALLKGGATPVCGLYVTETDSRLYLARVQVVREDGQTQVVDRSGRMLSIPRSQVERTDLGPLQDVTRAQEHAVDLRDELVAGQPGAAATEGGCVPPARTRPPAQSAQRALAERFQPRIVVNRNDRFWPISALTMFKLREHDQPPCRRTGAGQCFDVTRPSELPWNGGAGESLDYPGPDTATGAQHRDMVGAMGSADPASTAHEYFFVTGGNGGLTTIQYWLYYEFNYQPLHVGPTRPADAGFHEGDWESVDVLLSKSGRPVYLRTARHNGGAPFAWGEPGLERAGDHVTVHGAQGSHADYESCGRKHREEAGFGLIDDTTTCDPAAQLSISPSSTPMSDLAYAPWACWEGRFGSARRRPLHDVSHHYFEAGPLSPLWQQGFGRPASPCASVPNPPARPDVGEESTDEATATALRAAGGQLQHALDTCADWQQPPPNGVYAVACNDDQLKGFFASGLETPGNLGLSIGRPGSLDTATVPAIYRHATPESLDGLEVSARRATTATVYATCYAGDHPIVATFPDVPLEPGHPLTLQTGRDAWTLGDATATPSRAGRCDGR